jgi:hypothetical protein
MGMEKFDMGKMGMGDELCGFEWVGMGMTVTGMNIQLHIFIV